ncbi:hypothetical protein [Ferruginibacter albus]|uniref:hypothetical protein n=1 Tax=Ferruginibacter albus TaxID=2875540 RepID=UPI001CC4D33A|nr:hypothetical protein [Ferruginibacter albus]UAY51193.1 hypothetical protein K9M53_11400 [Ferruginibacter albus]
MRKTLFLFSLLTCMAITGLKAQNLSSDYTTALGLKFYPGAITIKHFIKDDAAIEGLGYFRDYGFRITGLYEWHQDIKDVQGLKWYVGGGAHVGFYGTKYGGGSSLGVDGVLGLDYKIQGAPINLSVDWQPSFEFGSNYGNGFYGGWGGIAIRYTF